MDNTANHSPKTQQLLQFFSDIKNVEVVPWQFNDKSVGLSILKDYPDKGSFIPARNKKGEKDSVAMIRIWYMRSNLISIEETKKIKLYIAIVKANRFLFKEQPTFNEDDEDTPTEISLAESKASKQPTDLEEFSRYELHFEEQKIYDLKKKQYVSGEEIIEEIYKVHLDTATRVLFQTTMKLHKWLIEIIEPTIKFLQDVNFYLFGKRIKQGDDFAVGIFKPYSFNDLIDLTLTSEKPKILGSDFPISYQTAGTFVVFFSLVYIIKDFYHYDLFEIVSFISGITNSFFLAVITAALLLLFDRLIPYIILLLINILIRIRLKLNFMKIKVF